MKTLDVWLDKLWAKLTPIRDGLLYLLRNNHAMKQEVSEKKKPFPSEELCLSLMQNKAAQGGNNDRQPSISNKENCTAKRFHDWIPLQLANWERHLSKMPRKSGNDRTTDCVKVWSLVGNSKRSEKVITFIASVWRKMSSGKNCVQYLIKMEVWKRKKMEQTVRKIKH